MNDYIKIEKVLKTSFSIFRDNYQLLILLSVIQSLIGFYSYLFESEDNPVMLILYIVAALVVVYFNLRLSITMILLIRDRYNNNIESTIKDSYLSSKDYLWNYFGTTILAGLIVALPVALFYVVFSFSDSVILKFLFSVSGIIVAVYLASNFYLAPIISVLEPGNSESLKRSMGIFKKDKKVVIYIISIIFFLLFFPLILSKLLGATGVVGDSLETLLSLFIYPISVCITVVLYYHLISNTEPSFDL